MALSLFATAVVAVGFEPMRAALVRRLDQSPYEQLAHFAATASHTVATEEVAPELARRAGEASSAAATEVLLYTAEPTAPVRIVGRWPPSPSVTGLGAAKVHRFPIRHGQEVLGELVVRQRPGRPLEPIEQRLVSDLCVQAGLAVRHVQLAEDLRSRVGELSERAVELRSSRQRVVAVADAERRRLERNIHDGAQQYLIALAINLALVRELLAHDPERVPPLIPTLHTAVHAAMAALNDLSRGLYPQQLADEGVAAALRAATATSTVPVTIEDAVGERYPPEVEVAAYFACLEAVQNAVKHSSGSRVTVRLTGELDALGLEITDDGAGFDVNAVGAAVGTVNLRDRLETVRGRAEVQSSSGTGTQVRAWIPTPTPSSVDRSQ